MELKVRALDAPEEKSVQQVEKELLDQHEQKQIDAESPNETVVQKVEETDEKQNPDTPPEENKKEEAQEDVEKVVDRPYDELKDEDVLSYIGKRYGKEINSIEELIAEREENEELPEDVAAYFKYKKETGRGIEDYARLQQDFSSMAPDTLLRQFVIETEGDGLDDEDIDSLLEEFSYDEEADDESTIKKIKLSKKRKIAKAKKYFKEKQELYKQPLESRPVESSEKDNEEFQAYKQYVAEAKTQVEEDRRKKEWFLQQTDQVFNKDFKGFEFQVGENPIVYSPGDAATLRKAQETSANFVNQYLDDKGLIKNAAGYHKALAVAMNPDKFAQFFYEQGKSEATQDVMRKTKNINMSERKAPEVTNKGGFKVKSLTPDTGRGLKIRSIKKM